MCCDHLSARRNGATPDMRYFAARRLSQLAFEALCGRLLQLGRQPQQFTVSLDRAQPLLAVGHGGVLLAFVEIEPSTLKVSPGARTRIDRCGKLRKGLLFIARVNRLCAPRPGDYRPGWSKYRSHRSRRSARLPSRAQEAGQRESVMDRQSIGEAKRHGCKSSQTTAPRAILRQQRRTLASTANSSLNAAAGPYRTSRSDLPAYRSHSRPACRCLPPPTST